MSRLAWVAPACVLAAVVAVPLLGTPAFADDPASSPSPPPTSSAAPLPVLPTPTPSASPAAPVTQLRAAVDTAGDLVVTWHAGAGDTAFTVTATAAAHRHRVESSGTSASFSKLPAGATVQIAVVAHGPGGDSAPVRITGAMPSAVPVVTGATMKAAPTGLLVSWQPSPHVAVGTRYLVELRGADGSVHSRMVAGTGVTVTGLTRGRLYTGSITAVTDSGRSAAAGLGGVVWTPPPAPAEGPIAAPPPAASTAPSATAAPHTAAPALADSPTRRTLVSSPVAAVSLAGLAVLLGGIAIGLLLRRPSGRPSAPATGTSPIARVPHP
jgi:hypothetical protein